jgi:hypothetical protein
MASRARQKTASNDNQAGGPAGDCTPIPGAAEFGALDLAGQFLIWSLRSWVQAFKSGRDFEGVTTGTYARFGLAAAAGALDRAMTLLAASTTRCIDIRCVPCRYLSPDELMLMDAVAAAQREGFFLATVILRKLVPGTAARAMLSPIVDLARDLKVAGLAVSPPTAPMRAQAAAIAELAAAPRPALLH